MNKHFMTTITTTFLLQLFAITAFSQSPNSGLKKLGDDILGEIQSFFPVHSTEMGIHSFDHRLADYSSSSVKKFTDKLVDYEKKLYKFKSARLSAYDKVNYHLLKSNVDIALQDLKRVKWQNRSPQLYIDEAVNGIYFLMLSKHAPLSEKLVPILSRMKEVPDLFETARKNISKPPPIYVEAALESLESGSIFFKQVSAELSKQFPEKADDIIKTVTRAREAMNDFAGHLSQISTGDDKSFAIGKENFEYKLTNEFFLNFDSDSLLNLGYSLLEKAQNEYNEYADYVETSHQYGEDSVFVPAQFTKTDVMNYYNWETEQLKIFLTENNIVTIPNDIAPVTVVETPGFLRSMIGGIAYQPAGPFDTVQQGYFYVRPLGDNPDRILLESRYRFVHHRGFKGSVVHEAYPGHHLQLQIAGMNADPVRKWQLNTMMIEGWALYCEEMMYEQGLFGHEDPAQWLAVLDGIRFRAARIVADVSLHTGKMTYDECVNWMFDALGVKTDSERDYIRKEVRRYTMTPTVQMAYLMGKLEIIKLRDTLKERQGEQFSLQNFHDAMLAEGAIPPTLMWEALELKRQ